MATQGGQLGTTVGHPKPFLERNLEESRDRYRRVRLLQAKVSSTVGVLGGKGVSRSAQTKQWLKYPEG